MAIRLQYIGKGDALVGVPARDLTDEDLQGIGHEFTWESLIRSGLYKKVEAETPKAEPKKATAKDGK
jgi:hypothetical protein